MPTFAEITDPLLGTYLRVLSVGPGVCDICHGAPNQGYSRCYSCDLTTGQVSMPVESVIPISMYTVGSQLHYALRSYKDGFTQQTRQQFGIQVAGLLGRFLLGHAACLRDAVGEWHSIIVVPSSQSRPRPHPLEAVLRLIPGLAPIQNVLERTDEPLDHQHASDSGYKVISDVAGERLLLIDDTFTSGARMQSAASSLQLAGAYVVAGVPVGRVINPAFNQANADLYDQIKSAPFTFEACGLEA